MYADTQIVKTMTVSWAKPLRIGIFSISLIIFCMFTYVFPILARFVNSVKVTIKNSLLMSIAHFPFTVLFILIDVLIIFIATRSGYALYTTLFCQHDRRYMLVLLTFSLYFSGIFQSISTGRSRSF